MRIAFALVAAAGAALAPITVAPPVPRSPARLTAMLDDLVVAYPQALARHDGARLFWHKGPPTPVGDPAAQRTTNAILAAPEIADVFAWPYPLGAAAAGPFGDPGRARPAALFNRLYGDCRAAPVRLVAVRWVRGRTVRFAASAGAAEALAAVARDLEALGPASAKYLWPIAGTYNCRTIAGTSDLSMHAYGAAIDLNPKWGAYWRWSARPVPAQTLPAGIVAAFERHGFIWGGKWAHFDSFHFEYRPELIRAARHGR